MLKLYLENALVELSEDFSCPITRTFEDLQNPTAIKNDFSKSIVIPHTQKNNTLFGHLYNPDRLTATGSDTTLKGIYFDPYKKIDFRLEWNDSVVMVGYLKVLSVDNKGYNCTLNGELGKIFQEMQKITFDEYKYTGEDKDKYWIDSSKYVNTKINKELVWDSWNSDGQTDLVLRKVGDPGYKVTDIIGFTPNNAFNSDFDYTSYENRTNVIEKLSSALDESAKNKRGVTFPDLTQVDSDTAVGDGITPRGMGEFRSYLQLPFIYYNKLFSIFKTKAETLTGYTLDLDENWFSSNNPYWKDLVLSLKNLQIESKTEVSNISFYGKIFGIHTIREGNDFYTPFFPVTNVDLKCNNTSTSNKSIYTPGATYINPVKPVKYSGTIPITFFLNGITKNTEYTQVSGIHQAVNISFYVYGENSGEIERLYLTGIIPKGADTSAVVFQQYNSTVEFPTVVPDRPQVTINAPFDFTLFPKYNERVKIVASVKIVGNDKGIFKPEVNSFTYSLGDSVNFETSWSITTSNVITPTNTELVLNDFWNENYTLFDIILNYCKIFRLMFVVDDLNKKIKIVQSVDYFSNYKVLNYTGKIDKSKDYIVTPITFENKYILFNYNDNDSEIAKNYKEQYKYNYGEKRLETKYQFNTETKDLFTNVNNIITYTPYIFNWNDLYNDLRIISKLPAEIYIDSGTDANAYNFGSLFFVNKHKFDTTSNLREVVISEDTELQISTGNYCYSQTNESINTDYYLEPSLKYNNNLCVFNTPQENYTYDNDYLDNTTGIYDNYWSSYIDERYNQQNKLVTCYLDIRPADFINFAFNKFLLIENQLYIVNKIYDYDINSNNTTKVDLITIQSIEGYTKNKLTI